MIRPTIFVKKTKQLLKKLRTKKDITEIKFEEIKNNVTDK